MESHRRALSKELVQFYLLGPDEVELNTRLLRIQILFLWEELVHSVLKTDIRQGGCRWSILVLPDSDPCCRVEGRLIDATVSRVCGVLPA